MGKRVLVMGDLHCGSMSGLTHPDWMIGKGIDQDFFRLQREMWDNYLEMIDHFGKVDTVVVNGDVIDGKGTRSGGTELITTDLFKQADMAIAAIASLNADSFYFTYGTPYHTSSEGGEDFDKIVADAFGSKIYDELDLQVEGVLFNIKHKTGASTSPYNRAQPVGRQRLWDTLKAIRNGDERASVFIRSHVHYFSFCGEAKWTGFTMPALQANSTKFGARQCVGSTDWGMCLFNVEDDVLAGWDCQMYELESHKKRIVKVG